MADPEAAEVESEAAEVESEAAKVESAAAKVESEAAGETKGCWALIGSVLYNGPCLGALCAAAMHAGYCWVRCEWGWQVLPPSCCSSSEDLLASHAASTLSADLDIKYSWLSALASTLLIDFCIFRRD